MEEDGLTHGVTGDTRHAPEEMGTSEHTWRRRKRHQRLDEHSGNRLRNVAGPERDTVTAAVLVSGGCFQNTCDPHAPAGASEDPCAGATVCPSDRRVLRQENFL